MMFPCANPSAVVKRAFWLAWQACGSPFGFGVMRDQPGATENDVWANIGGQADYPGGTMAAHTAPDGALYADYVFGRMMKCSFRWTDEAIEISEAKPREDYQSWCRKYPSYEALVQAAVADLKR